MPGTGGFGGGVRALWDAGSIAVVGASNRPDAPGHLVVAHLRRYGYRGRILPVNPAGGTILGLPGFATVADAAATGPVELAVILVPASAVPDAVGDCAKAGVACAIVGTSGFAETGEAGRRAQAELVERAGGMRLVGPNCIGSVGFAAGQVASFSPLFGGWPPPLPAGPVGFASTSGALGYGTVSLALERGLGLYAAVSTGNEADVTAAGALIEMAADEGCAVLLGYVESLSSGDELRALAATGKPAALLVAGSSASGGRAAASHTGALATDARIVAGALRQLGIAQVSDVDELLDVGDAFVAATASGRWPAGDRVAVVTTSGGSGILAADAIEAHGLRLASLSGSTVDALAAIVPAYGSTANPVDVTATVMRDRTLVGRCLDVVAADPAVDTILVCFCVLTGEDVDAIVDALADAARRSGKPVLVARTGADALAPSATPALRAAGLAAYATPRRAVRALSALLDSRAPSRRSRSHGAGPAPVGTPSSPSQLHDRRDRGESAVKAWLAGGGVAVPRGRVVTGAEAAREAVRELGGRAVFKASLPRATHKTELGGVLLGVTESGAADAYSRLAAIRGATGVLVEEQLPAGVEILVGVVPTPLGPALTVGAGGVLADALDDVAVRLLPVTPADIRDALGGLRVARLLNGFRGAAPSDVDALVDLIRAVAERAAGLPEGAALDVNPVVALPDRAIALDAAIVLPEES